MFLKQLFHRKSLETLLAEMAGENRLRRILGPVQLTALGVGAIIGSGIFVMTGRAAAEDAGPAIMLSYCVAGLGCALAAFCYAEFASMAPVAGSAYTYAYATLGELLAWIIGWDLILEYAMSCGCVSAAWSNYFNQFLLNVFGKGYTIPEQIRTDPWSYYNLTGSFVAGNLLAVLIMIAVTAVLVIGIRESATANAILTSIKLGVVLFVIAAGIAYINSRNWTGIPISERRTAGEFEIGSAVSDYLHKQAKETGRELPPPEMEARVTRLRSQVLAAYKLAVVPAMVERLEKAGKVTPEAAATELQQLKERYTPLLPTTQEDQASVAAILPIVEREGQKKATEKWGVLGYLGINNRLLSIDDATRTTFTPYGISGIMLGAGIVFFAFIGFDSISAHSEEARVPQRDVPIGILASLAICTLLYFAVSAVITGMEPYPEIDTKAAIAAAFGKRAEIEKSSLLHASAGLIATGALAGMTSVLLITFLSQARIFLAMARDGFLPAGLFAAIHPRFRTPHLSTMLTGAVICFVAALTPIEELEAMVNIGTLFAFIVVCAAVLLLRIQRPDAHRPFRCPAVFVLAPLGIFVNLLMALFLPAITWYRLLLWLLLGLGIYFVYGYWNSTQRQAMLKEQGGLAGRESPVLIKGLGVLCFLLFAFFLWRLLHQTNDEVPAGAALNARLTSSQSGSYAHYPA